MVLALLLAGSISYVGWRQTVPGVRAELTSALSFIGVQTPVTLQLIARGGRVAAVELRLVQGATTITVLKREFPEPQARRERVEITIEGKTLGLREGKAQLEVLARDDFWRPIRFDDRPVLTSSVTLDLTPPTLDILAATRYLAQGGSGVVVFRARGGERAGVTVGDQVFPAFPVGDPDRGNWVALIGLPYNFPTSTPRGVSVVDKAGNQTTRSLPSVIRPRRFPVDVVEVKEEFLRRKLPELLPEWDEIPEEKLVEAFLKVNRDKRSEAEEAKRRIAGETQPKALWEGTFLHPRNAKVFSNFAETRTYRVRGRRVDTQVHFGYDLASVRESPVLAANSGVVVFAELLTIYGKTVVVDHGLGLQTLYAHLSRIDAQVGDHVEKGQELGRTGSTGFAVGDHLHYEMLIHGVSVTPLEWWDAQWLRDHILDPLKTANVVLTEG